MNKFVIFLSLLLLSGCVKHSNIEPYSVSNLPVRSQPRDAADHVEDATGTAVRFVYDEGTKAWKFLTSEEMVAKYGRVWESAKTSASSAYNSAKDSFESIK